MDNAWIMGFLDLFSFDYTYTNQDSSSSSLHGGPERDITTYVVHVYTIILGVYIIILDA